MRNIDYCVKTMHEMCVQVFVTSKHNVTQRYAGYDLKNIFRRCLALSRGGRSSSSSTGPSLECNERSAPTREKE